MKIYFSLITVVLLLAFTRILSPIYGQWLKYPIDDNFYRPTIVVVDDIDGDTDPDGLMRKGQF